MAMNSFLKQIKAVRRDGLPQTRRMSSYFFQVIATFWILKPLKNLL